MPLLLTTSLGSFLICWFDGNGPLCLCCNDQLYYLKMMRTKWIVQLHEQGTKEGQVVCISLCINGINPHK